jgi:hypothetical protein
VVCEVSGSASTFFGGLQESSSPSPYCCIKVSLMSTTKRRNTMFHVSFGQRLVMIIAYVLLPVVSQPLATLPKTAPPQPTATAPPPPSEAPSQPSKAPPQPTATAPPPPSEAPPQPTATTSPQPTAPAPPRPSKAPPQPTATATPTAAGKNLEPSHRMKREERSKQAPKGGSQRRPIRKI